MREALNARAVEVTIPVVQEPATRTSAPQAAPSGGEEAAQQPGRKPRPPLKQTFRALRNPNYRLFWFGQVVSMVGTWMQRIAQAWLVLRLTDSPLALGIVTACQTLPVLLFALFGGVIADRVPKRRLLVITQTMMLVQAVVLAAAHRRRDGFSLDRPLHPRRRARHGDRARQPDAAGIRQGDGRAGRCAERGRAQLDRHEHRPPDRPRARRHRRSRAIGVAGCFALNAVSFLAVIGALLLMRPERFYEVPSPARGKMLAQIGEGLRYAVRTPEIALVMLLIGGDRHLRLQLHRAPAADRPVRPPCRPDRFRRAHLRDGGRLADRRASASPIAAG